MPAVTFNDLADVLPVTESLMKGGLDVMEITFRSGVAAEAIKLVRKYFPEMKVGAGTLLSPQQVDEAVAAGAMFGVAPGCNISVVRAAEGRSLPFIPGIITASELEMALEMGCPVVKIFPCDLSGGTSLVRALEAPYAHTGVKFIPMGGINLSNLHEYAAFEIVLAAGGSWIASREAIQRKDFARIRENAKQSITIMRLLEKEEDK